MNTGQDMQPPTRPWLGTFAVLMAATLCIFGFASPASAQEMAESYSVAGEVAPDGTLTIAATITFEGAGPAQLEQRLATTRQQLNYTQLDYEIFDITVTAGGADLAPTISTDGDYKVISVDASKAGDAPVVISYKVRGAALGLPKVEGQPDMTEVSWRVLQGLSVGARTVSGEIALPLGAHTTDIDCQAGPPSNTASCSTYASGTYDAMNPSFTDGPRGPGEVVILTFALPSAAVAPNQVLTEQWTLDRAFSAEPLALLAALVALLLGGGGLYLLHRTRGTDAAGAPTLVAHFEPVAAGEERFRLVEPILPGEVGTLVDEHVDPIDITATIVDLAQRGHLTIVELPKTTVHGVTEWTFERGPGGDELLDYERTIVDALAPAQGEAALVSEIGQTLGPVVPKVQEQVYDEMVKKGWFSARPDKVRGNWARVGTFAVVGSLAVLALLVAFTKLGLLGLVLVGLAVGLLWVSQQMARRTTKGTSVLKGLQVLAMNLAVQPVSSVPREDAYAEISRILPYAIVLGSLDRWLQALVDADDDPGVPDPDDLGWYRAPATWQLSDLPNSIDTFITTVEGRLYSRRLALGNH